MTVGAPPIRSGSEILSIIDHLGLKKVAEVNAYALTEGLVNHVVGENEAYSGIFHIGALI